MSARRLRFGPRAGEWLALVAAVALAASLFLPWYAPARTAWDAFALLDVFLVLTALVGGALWTLAATQEAEALPVAFAALTTLLGAIATVWVAFRLLVPPLEPIDRLAGAFVGLSGAAGVLMGGVLAMREDPEPWGEERRRALEREAARVEVLRPPDAPAGSGARAGEGPERGTGAGPGPGRGEPYGAPSGPRT